jgi:hypothetical protein
MNSTFILVSMITVSMYVPGGPAGRAGYFEICPENKLSQLHTSKIQKIEIITNIFHH